MKISRWLGVGVRFFGRTMAALGRGTIALVGICGVVAALANYTMTQGTGTTFGSIVVSTVHYAQMLLCDPTTPSQCAGVNPSGQIAIQAPPSLPLPTGAATAAKQPAIGTAGSPSTDVLTMQGSASGTPIPVAASAGAVTTGTLQSAAVANGNGTLLGVSGYSSAILTVNCATCSGGTTINFEGTQDGTNFASLSVTQLGANLIAQSTAVSGVTVWQAQVAGMVSIRARISGYSAGTVTVTAQETASTYSSNVVTAAGEAVGAPTTGSQGSRVDCATTTYAPTTTNATNNPCSTDLLGGQRVVSQASSSKVSNTASATGTGSTSLIAAVTSERIYVQNVSCSNSGASASVVSFQDGSGGPTLWSLIVPAGGGNNMPGGGVPLFWTTAGNALFFASGASTTTLFCNASGYAGN